MFLPQLDCFDPINFVCIKCVAASEIPNKIPIRKSSSKTTLKDLTVSDVIVTEKPLRGILLKLKGAGRKVQVYK